jgi:hypothetical protein
MAEAKGNIWLSPPPPPAVLRGMNVVMRPLLSSPFGSRIKGVMLLEFSGRRSGRNIKVPVNFHLVDGVPMAFTNSPWRHNFAGGSPVTVTYRGRRHDTRGTLVPVTSGSAQRMGIRTARGYVPTAADLAALGPALGTSIIEFDFRP